MFSPFIRDMGGQKNVHYIQYNMSDFTSPDRRGLRMAFDYKHRSEIEKQDRKDKELDRQKLYHP